MPGSEPVIDLRSDTVTRPTAAMRKAIAEAEVGDDVFGEDPSVNKLQATVATLLGKPAALFVPTGCMANQIAINIHTEHGDEMLAGTGAHSYLFETGGTSALSGVQVTILPGDGRFEAGDLEAAYKPDDHHHAPTRLVMVENTHNMAGGVLWGDAELAAVCGMARKLSLKLHLDGARLWNAAVACGRPAAELCAEFDTVSVCLSKGLGAPVGSILAGEEHHIHRAHRVRKRLGGGMRQAGILAAAGQHAVDHHRERLAEDHENARQLARALAGCPGLDVEINRVQTNIVMVDLTNPDLDAATMTRQAKARGVYIGVISPRRIRLVTHLDVDSIGCKRAAAVLRDLAGG